MCLLRLWGLVEELNVFRGDLILVITSIDFERLYEQKLASFMESALR